MSNPVFLLSPARSDGQRARMLLSDSAAFPLAVALRGADGAPLGEVFSFLSGLYFRGKLAYARAFAAPAVAPFSPLIITTDRGLVSPEEHVRRDDLHAFSRVDIAAGDERFLTPLRHDTLALAEALDPKAEVVLLGSIATGKYVDTLLHILGDRLVFPAEFVGRGDMSRGGLMLRCAREGRELEYVGVRGAVRHGKRPPKLEPVR